MRETAGWVAVTPSTMPYDLKRSLLDGHLWFTVASPSVSRQYGHRSTCCASTSRGGGVMADSGIPAVQFPQGTIAADDLLDSLDDLEIDVLIDDDGEPTLL